MSQEQWRPVDGWVGTYEVSDLGRVRRLYKTREPRILAQRAHPQRGYIVVDLQRAGKTCTQKVHRLVANAFLGPRPEGLVTRHLNDDKNDNRLVNLAYGTHLENARDRELNGIPNPSSAKTHCPQGHPYDAQNTARVGNRRHCRACHREHQRAYVKRRAAA